MFLYSGDGTGRDDNRIFGHHVSQLFSVHLFHGCPVKKGRRGVKVTKGPDLGLGPTKSLIQQATNGIGGETPVIAVAPVDADWRDGRDRDQCNAAGPKRGSNLPKRRDEVKNILERLRQDDAVETIGWKDTRNAQIADDCGAWVGVIDMEYILARDPAAAKLPRIVIVTNFEHRAANVSRMIGEKSFDIQPINRLSAIEARGGAKRPGPGDLADSQTGQAADSAQSADQFARDRS